MNDHLEEVLREAVDAFTHSAVVMAEGISKALKTGQDSFALAPPISCVLCNGPAHAVSSCPRRDKVMDPGRKPVECGWNPADATVDCDWDPACVVHGNKPVPVKDPCVCGESGTPGTVHRTDGPCYLRVAPDEPLRNVGTCSVVPCLCDDEPDRTNAMLLEAIAAAIAQADGEDLSNDHFRMADAAMIVMHRELNAAHKRADGFRARYEDAEKRQHEERAARTRALDEISALRGLREQTRKATAAAQERSSNTMEEMDVRRKALADVLEVGWERNWDQLIGYARTVHQTLRQQRDKAEYDLRQVLRERTELRGGRAKGLNEAAEIVDLMGREEKDTVRATAMYDTAQRLYTEAREAKESKG